MAGLSRDHLPHLLILQSATLLNKVLLTCNAWTMFRVRFRLRFVASCLAILSYTGLPASLRPSIPPSLSNASRRDAAAATPPRNSLPPGSAAGRLHQQSGQCIFCILKSVLHILHILHIILHILHILGNIHQYHENLHIAAYIFAIRR